MPNPFGGFWVYIWSPVAAVTSSSSICIQSKHLPFHNVRLSCGCKKLDPERLYLVPISKTVVTAHVGANQAANQAKPPTFV